MTAPDFRFDGPAAAPLTVALAHGAGAPMDSPFMAFFAAGLAGRGYRVARFEFPYMAERRRSGLRRPPDPGPVLLGCWRSVIAELGRRPLAIGGKSLGGRTAAAVAAELDAALGRGNGAGAVRAVVCLGYPFHAPGRPEAARTEPLRSLATPTLVLQGSRDPFGSRDEVAGYALGPAVRLHWLEDGDHGFAPRKSSRRSERQNWDEAIEAIAAFLAGR